MIANHTGIHVVCLFVITLSWMLTTAQRFSRMLREYDQARRIGSYLHQYKQYPMFSKDFGEFDDARWVWRRGALYDADLLVGRSSRISWTSTRRQSMRIIWITGMEARRYSPMDSCCRDTSIIKLLSLAPLFLVDAPSGYIACHI